MKKIGCILVVGLLMTLMCTSAMAAGVGIQLNGKTYTFCKTSGEYSVDGTYVVDGVTFVFDGDQVTIKQDGKPEEVRTLVSSEEAVTVRDAAEAVVPVAAGESTLVQELLPQPTESMLLPQPTEGVLISVAQEAQDGSAQVQASAENDVIVQSSSSGQSLQGVVVYDIPAAAVSDGSEYTVIANTEPVRGADYSVYERYGMSFDAATRALSYQGKRVRIFQDEYPSSTDGYAVASLEKVDEEGVIDVIAQHGEGFELIGLYVLSQEDFDSRDITSYIAPVSMAVAVTESGQITPSELKALYDVYAPLGLSYDMSTDIMSYQGQTVRQFTDVQQTNDPASGYFSGSMMTLANDFGVIDVSTIRDFTKLDADGNGTLTGLRVTPVK